MDKNQLKRISTQLNDWRAKDDWNAPRVLKVEHTGFFPMHSASRGLNSTDANALEFTTKLIEARSVLINKSASDTFGTLYIKSAVDNYKERGVFLDLRFKGRTLGLELDGRDVCYSLQRLFGAKFHELMPEEYAAFCKRLESERSSVPTIGERGRVDVISDWQVENKFNHSKAELFEINSLGYQFDEARELLLSLGVRILQKFEYTHKYWISMECISASSRGFEINWYSTGTYNSLPNTLRVSKCTGMPLQRLDTLGLEKRGYYSHDVKASIPAEQAEKAKRFFKRRIRKLG